MADVEREIQEMIEEALPDMDDYATERYVDQAIGELRDNMPDSSLDNDEASAWARNALTSLPVAPTQRCSLGDAFVTAVFQSLTNDIGDGDEDATEEGGAFLHNLRVALGLDTLVRDQMASMFTMEPLHGAVHVPDDPNGIVLQDAPDLVVSEGPLMSPLTDQRSLRNSMTDEQKATVKRLWFMEAAHVLATGTVTKLENRAASDQAWNETHYCLTWPQEAHFVGFGGDLRITLEIPTAAFKELYDSGF